MNYDKHNAKPFCTHFYNCKYVNNKKHNREFMHPCVKGASCDDIEDKKHTQCWYHFRLPTCPYGSSCPQIGDPSHRASYHHEAKEKEPAIRDYMLPCDYHSRCIINDDAHRLVFQHNLPFVFPKDDIAPKYKFHVCQGCFKMSSKCTCEAGRAAHPERTFKPPPPSTQSRDRTMIVHSNSMSRSSSSSFSPNSVVSSFDPSPPSTQSRSRIMTPNSTQISMSVPRYSVSPIFSVTPFAKSKSVVDFCCGEKTLKWAYDFKMPPQFTRKWRSEEYIFDGLLTPGINEI